MPAYTGVKTYGVNTARHAISPPHCIHVLCQLANCGTKANVGNLFVCGSSESVNDNDPVWTAFYKQRPDFMDNKRTILRRTGDGLVVVGNQNLVAAN